MDNSSQGSVPPSNALLAPQRPTGHHGSFNGDDHEEVAHDPLDDILDQYQFHWVPEYRLKIKKE